MDSRKQHSTSRYSTVVSWYSSSSVDTGGYCGCTQCPEENHSISISFSSCSLCCPFSPCPFSICRLPLFFWTKRDTVAAIGTLLETGTRACNLRHSSRNGATSQTVALAREVMLGSEKEAETRTSPYSACSSRQESRPIHSRCTAANSPLALAPNRA